jgi:hypothetical protein
VEDLVVILILALGTGPRHDSPREKAVPERLAIRFQPGWKARRRLTLAQLTLREPVLSSSEKSPM